MFGVRAYGSGLEFDMRICGLGLWVADAARP